MNKIDQDYILYYPADAMGKLPSVSGEKARRGGWAEDVKNGVKISIDDWGKVCYHTIRVRWGTPHSR